MKTSIRRAALPLAVALLAGFALVGCGDSDEPAASTTTTTEKAKEELTIDDSWVKATTEPMSAAFGVLKNGGDTDIVITGASTSVAPKVELHETVAAADGSMKMQPKEGGFTVPAGGELTLQPGGNHIMLMDMTKPITAGEDVKITLELEGGGTMEFTATAKDFTGANETYDDGTGGMGGGMGGAETTTTMG